MVVYKPFLTIGCESILSLDKNFFGRLLETPIDSAKHGAIFLCFKPAERREIPSACFYQHFSIIAEW